MARALGRPPPLPLVLFKLLDGEHLPIVVIADEAVAGAARVFAVIGIGGADSALEKGVADPPGAAFPFRTINQLQPLEKAFQNLHRGLLEGPHGYAKSRQQKSRGPHIHEDISATRLSPRETL